MRKLLAVAVVFAVALGAGCPGRGGPGGRAPAAGEPAAGESAPDPALPTEVDVGHVHPGQRYVYRSAGVEQAYTVLAIGEDAIRCSFALVVGGREATASEVSIPITPEGWGEREQADAPPAAVETVTVGALRFPCRVVERDGVRSWLSPLWTPGGVRVTQGEEVLVELVRVEEP